MNNLTRALLLAPIAWGALGIGDAVAYPRYYPTIEARPVFRKKVYISSGGTHSFETDRLGAPSQGICFTPDTFMVVTRPDGVSYANDDCDESSSIYPVFSAGRTVSPSFRTKRSCTKGYSATRGWWTITVFAANPLACGSTDVLVDGSSVGNRVDFGGTLVQLGVESGRAYAYETVHTPDGANDTFMILYDSAWREKSYDDDGGIGRAARITATMRPGDKLMVGSWSPQSAGYTSITVNDCVKRPDDPAPQNTQCRSQGRDADRDNLSDQLEAELGTDPNSHDTDKDGLFDYYEAIGRRLPNGTEQEMKRYGADPLRRDLFVELDRSNTAATPMESVVATMQQSFYDLPTMDENPDGTQGITLHMDIGVPCVDTTLCGDWGGSAVLTLAGNVASSYGQARQNMAGVRQGLFHYGYLTQGGGGQAAVGASSFWADSGCTSTHELGHNLGLNHWGDPVPPGTAMNIKPAYPSTMNYAYQCELPGIVDRPRFSEGKMQTLVPNAVDESSYSPGQNTLYLEKQPFYYPKLGQGLDFNYDGRTNAPGGGTIAADLTPLGRKYEGGGWPDMLQQRAIGTRTPTGGGALAVEPMGTNPLDARVWSFAPFDHGATGVYPDYTRIREIAGVGAPATWPNWTTGVPLNGHPNGEATAITFQMQVGRRILLLFPNAAGVMNYRLINPANPGAGNWAPIPNWPAGSRARNASVTVAGNAIEVVWRDLSRNDSEFNVYGTRLDDGGVWSTPALQNIRAFNTPGIAAAPDGYTYLAGVDTSDLRLIVFLRRAQGTTGAWQGAAGLGSITSDLHDSYDREPQPLELRRRLQLMFVPHRTTSGNFADGSGYLALWWNVGYAAEGDRDKWVYRRAYLGGHLSPTESALEPTPGARFQKFKSRPFPDHSITAAMRGNDVVLYYNGIDWDTSALTTPYYVPFASGIAPVATGVNADNDDAATIATTMCSSVWDIVHEGSAGCYCSTLETTNCAPGPEKELVTCDFK